MVKTASDGVILGSGETELWHGKPQKRTFIAKKTLTMLPIAVVWFCLDSGIIISSLKNGELLWFIIPFFTLHLMPVWIWLANVITANRCWKNTNYYITNRRIIIQSGFFAVNETSLFYKDIRNAQVKIGLINKMFGTGDIFFDQCIQDEKKGFVFEALEDSVQIYNRVQKIILDIQTDIEYPNALRPQENFGYNTDYRP